MSKKRSKNKIYKDRSKEFKPTLPISQAQSEFLDLIKNNIITFGIGSSGTGKTYCSMSLAIDYLRRGWVDKIIITRPAIESSKKSLGALPGELEDKFAPYLKPIEAVIQDKVRNASNWLECQKKNGNIVVEPLNYMQGQTYKKAFIIADEMQNSDKEEMFMLLSRTGEDSKVVVNGDYKMQKMIRGISGLQDAECRLQDIDDIAFYTFEPEDNVRSGISRDIVEAYETDEE